MDHVLRHVCVAVCGLCYKTGCTEHVARHCMQVHGQKDFGVSSGMLGRFLVHPDLLESFIAFCVNHQQIKFVGVLFNLN